MNNKAVELRVLQYGATRQRLEEALLEQAGWDVVHLSGHGLAGGLVFEDDAGRPGPITSDGAGRSVRPGRDQLKLMTLSACESAAVTAGEHLRLLGLAPGRDSRAGARTGRRRRHLTGLAMPEGGGAGRKAGRRVAGGGGRVGGPVGLCGVGDALPGGRRLRDRAGGSFYDLVLGKGQPVARALAAEPACRAPTAPTPGVPALSAAPRRCSGPAPPT